MSQYKSSLSNTPYSYVRRQSIEVPIGGVVVGGSAPIRLQSMANVSTMDTEAAIAQAERIIAAGADYIRYTAQGRKEAANLAHIRQGIHDRGHRTPLIADIHFNPQAADEALEHIEKVRVNPGNYVDTKTAVPRVWTDEVYREMHERVVERFGQFVERAKTLRKTIRIGVNHGSLSERMVMLYGDTPEGMVQSALEYLDVCQKHDFRDIVISMKSSNTTVMTAAVRLLVERLDEGGYPAYPLHLGVTEAGEGEDGRIKSAVGIGSLLMDGIGDTIRVSLSEDPEFEIPVARTLVDYISSRTPLKESWMAHAPLWERYKELAQGARKGAHSIGKLIGGDNLPVVLLPQQYAEQANRLEQKPDYLLSPAGSWATLSGTPILDSTTERLVPSMLLEQEAYINDIVAHPERILLLDTEGDNPTREWRLMLALLKEAGANNPILLAHTYTTNEAGTFLLQAAADLGTVLLDGWGHGLCLSAPNLPVEVLVKTQFGILQATRLRMSKTEFISCPGCGRTLYNLQETIARVKGATSHLKGLKIGIMGCIVNGPGEMADADYGYVGAAAGKIDLYKGQICVRKGVDQSDAVNQLIELIKSEGDWTEPSEA